MKKRISFITIILVTLSLTSCKKFIDVNTDPNNPTTTTPNNMLPSIISNAFQMQGFEAYQFIGLLTQNIGRRGAALGTFEQYFFANNVRPFQDTYQIVGANIPVVIASAQAEGSAYYVGAAKVMYALILAHATDLLGDIPYTEAFNAALTISPKYDSQQSIYAVVDKLLDEGIAEFQKPASSNFRALYISTPNISGDILYKGDVSKWIKLAYALKARQNNHLTKKAAYNPTTILTYIDKALAVNADDAQLYWETAGGTTSGTTNVFGPTRGNFGSITYGRFFIEMLNGKNLLGDANLPDDPRLPIMATTASTGTMPGANNASATADWYGNWYSTDIYNSGTGAGVLQIITNAEIRFIEAEAAFRLGTPAGLTRAYTAYLAGINAHMDKMNVPAATPGSARDIYLKSAAVAQSAATLTLKNIMQQKYIAMFMNVESFADMRRLDFDQAIYPGFYYPTGANTVAAGKYPRRTYYPITEVTLNPLEVEKQGGNAVDFFLKPMWFDQP